MTELYETCIADNFKVTCFKNDIAITPELRKGNLWGHNMEELVKELLINTRFTPKGCEIDLPSWDVLVKK